MAKPKPQHVNLSTPPADIIATMAEEMQAVRYHKRKAYGGTRKYEIWKQELKEKALAGKQNQLSELTEWISRVGNRWVMYSSEEYFPDSERVLPCHAAFIYYETYASCGAFFPTFDESSSKVTGVVVFTSHFFQRLSERAKVPFRSKAMIQEFISSNFMRTVTSQDKAGGEVIMRFRIGYGLGTVLSVDPYAVEIRTFLTDEQLSPSQRKRVEVADMDARIIAKLGALAGSDTLRTLDHIAYFFAALAKEWHGFDPTKHSDRELLLWVAEAMPPKFFDPFMEDGKKEGLDIEKFTDDTCDVIISVANTHGYEGWTREKVQQGIIDIMEREQL